MDIDEIQAHGVCYRSASLLSVLTHAGVGASEISKLKANGIYTVAVNISNVQSIRTH